MVDFNEREQGFEKNFEHEQEVAFKIKARRNYLLGRWAASQLGLSGEPAESYARALTDPAQHFHGDDEIVKKILVDFQATGTKLDGTRVYMELALFAAQAEKQLKA